MARLAVEAVVERLDGDPADRPATYVSTRAWSCAVPRGRRRERQRLGQKARWLGGAAEK